MIWKRLSVLIRLTETVDTNTDSVKLKWLVLVEHYATVTPKQKDR